MALAGTDYLYIQRGADRHRLSYADLAAAIHNSLPSASASTAGAVKVGANLAIDGSGVLSASLPNAVEYKGAIDMTDLAAIPAAPGVGDLYVSTGAGTFAAGFTGLAGAVALGQMILWDGAKWDPVGAMGGNTAVTSITGTAPISVGGTASIPEISVADATTSAKGVVQLADAAAITAGTAGRLVDAAQLKAATPALPTASASALGVVKVGANLAIDGNGVLSAQLSNVLHYKGAVDATDPAAVPATPGAGDLLVVTVDGTADAGFTGVGGTAVYAGEMLMYDGAKWDVVGLGAATVGVSTLTATAPIQVGGTATDPALSIDAATQTDPGVVQLADAAAIAAGTAGRVIDAAEFLRSRPGAASASTAGLARLADGAAIAAGTAGRLVDAAQLKAAAYSLPTAAAATLGGVKIGSGLAIDAAGVLSAPPYSLPTAAAATLGGVKIGANLAVDGNGVLSARIPGALVYRGALDFTDAASLPGTLRTGDLYLANKAGVPDAAFVGLTDPIQMSEMLIWDGAKWDPVGVGSGNVEAVTGTAPVTIGGTAGRPDVSVADATAAAKGVTQLADAAAITTGTAGRVVDAAQLLDARKLGSLTDVAQSRDAATGGVISLIPPTGITQKPQPSGADLTINLGAGGTAFTTSGSGTGMKARLVIGAVPGGGRYYFKSIVITAKGQGYAVGDDITFGTYVFYVGQIDDGWLDDSPAGGGMVVRDPAVAAKQPNAYKLVNLPGIATQQRLGMVKVKPLGGLGINSNGEIYIDLYNLPTTP